MIKNDRKVSHGQDDTWVLFLCFVSFENWGLGPEVYSMVVAFLTGVCRYKRRLRTQGVAEFSVHWGN